MVSGGLPKTRFDFFGFKVFRFRLHIECDHDVALERSPSDFDVENDLNGEFNMYMSWNIHKISYN